jgi:hypothetical protein
MHDRRALNAMRVFARRGGEFRRGSAGSAYQLSGILVGEHFGPPPTSRI